MESQCLLPIILHFLSHYTPLHSNISKMLLSTKSLVRFPITHFQLLASQFTNEIEAIIRE